MKLVLLHAFPLDSRMWEPQLEAFGDRPVASPELYGRGTTIADYAASLLAEIDGELAAVGASMGGYVALALARAAPERVRALGLVGARADADTPERKEARATSIALVEREGPEALWREMQARLLSENAPPDAVARARAIALEQEPKRLVEALVALRDRPDATEVVRSFAGPALVAVGERDPFFSVDEARALAALAPEARLEVFPGAGHLPSLEQPARFNAALSAFLSPLSA